MDEQPNTPTNSLTWAGLVDIFDESKYPVDADGFTQVPAQEIYQALASLFYNGYSEDVHEGVCPDGRPYVRYTLEVSDPEGGPFKARVTGYAEPKVGQTMSYAGLLTMARRQAVLRGLHMGHSMYAKTTVAETTPITHAAPTPISNAAPTSPSGNGRFTPISSVTAPATRTWTPGGGGGAGRKPFATDGSDWTGTAKLKSGPNVGKMWKDVPIEHIQKMASGSNPIQLAVWELERRNREAFGTVYAAVDTVVAEAAASQDARLDAALAELPPVPGEAQAVVASSGFTFKR
jgi:hypothetical protein